jgi:hypothetical protein
MKKIDFTKVAIENIDGSFETADLAKTLGNAIWVQAKSLEVSELGRKIWRDGDVEVSNDEIAILNEMIPNIFPAYIVKKALLDLLND